MQFRVVLEIELYMLCFLLSLTYAFDLLSFCSLDAAAAPSSPFLCSRSRLGSGLLV
jgi:hypothetical protein